MSAYEYYHDWNLRNVYIAQTLEHYVMRGFEPGGFATAVLANDLFAAVSRADHWNRGIIQEIAQEITKNVPKTAYGSYEAVQAWIDDEDERRSKYVTWRILQGTVKVDDTGETTVSIF